MQSFIVYCTTNNLIIYRIGH